MNKLTRDAQNISMFKKEKFLKELSEDEFRDRVIRPLFLRLGYQDGRDLCGPTEQGKDAIFTEVDKLGITQLIAVQTKKGNLNLSSNANQNILQAITQLKTALQTKVPWLSSKEKRLPSGVILCASGKINDRARSHIVEEVKEPRIQFLDSDDLIPLLDEKLPEFWLGIEANVLPYFRAIKESIENRYSVDAGVASANPVLIDALNAASDQSFIALTLYKPRLDVHKVRGNITNRTKFDEIPITSIQNEKTRKILILGEAGSGKSTAIWRIAYLIANQGIKDTESYKIPVVVKASDLVRLKPDNLVSYCDNVTRKLAKVDKPCFTENELQKGQLVVLIDALDEVQSEYPYVLKLAEDFYSNYPKSQIIITSRSYKNILNTLRSTYEVFFIHAISWKQAEKIVRKLQEGKKIPSQDSQELLRRLEQVHGIELSPLMITVFAATAEYSRHDIPANITELFKKFTELMLGRWDEGKGLSQQYQAPLKDFLLKKLGFQIHKSKSTSISESDFRKLTDEELTKRGHQANIEQLIEETLYRSGLFRIANESIEFKHHLLQEFFAGRGIGLLPGHSSSDFINQVISDDWWKKAIVFYFGENPENVDNLKTIIDSVDRKDLLNMDLFNVAMVVGLATQACYLSQVTEKLEIWKWTISTFSKLSVTRIEDTSVEQPIIDFLFNFYLRGRDSVALSNVKEHISDVETWVQHCEQQKQERMFWLMVSLIEIGELNSIEKLLKKFSGDSKYLFAIYLGCLLTKEIRAISNHKRKEAESLIQNLEEKVVHLKVELLKEFKTLLFEIRKNYIEVIENRSDHENENHNP